MVRPVPIFRYRTSRAQQRGAVAVMVVAMVFIILGGCGLAIDLGLMYNRRVEMQNLADATALSAAAELDGTAAGVTRAIEAAATIAQDFSYSYVNPIAWSNAALKFSNSPSHAGDWVAADDAKAAPGGRLFVQVDTLALDKEQGTVRTMFMDVLGVAQSAQLQGYAIAGRTGVKVTPLAVCALSNVAAAPRATGAGYELVEFGFRRGVSYNLMNLNPNGTTPENFVVNPFAPPGTLGTAGPTSPAIVGPYVCTGTMSMARVLGGNITVARPFPLASLVNQLNSRFDHYTGGACNRINAPPDQNIKAFTYTALSWMSTVPTGQSAAIVTGGGKLVTIADASPTPAGSTAGMFGPLWSYAKAVPFGVFVSGQPEPATGYTTFSSTDWAKLYDPGQPKAGSYPVSVPYLATSSPNYLAPTTSVKPQSNRRVLNLPLLSCPVDSGTTVAATAVGIGKFFMTVPATTSAIHAEFAGLISDQALSSSTGLFP